ncbi:MAG: DUF3800 domain-containing protein, partial [Albidovulum sp.]|nr:DUF3800 domain-containing protein [Albidovulum sp.]
GTPDIPGNTSHFVLAGVSIPIWHWRQADQEVTSIKSDYGLRESEIHTAWLLRKYLEQSRIIDFETLTYDQRRAEVTKARTAHLLRLQRNKKKSAYRQIRKNYKQTEAYIHLTLTERRRFIKEVADCVSGWGFARLFAECIDKIHFNPKIAPLSLDEQAFEQVVSRFERYLQNIDGANGSGNYGLIVHDNNETVARRHTRMMRTFHQNGTLWINIQKIIETPLFVDSKLTSMVQLADLCGYSLRRYLENSETCLFERVYSRADRQLKRTVGVRHFTHANCKCTICRDHRN